MEKIEEKKQDDQFSKNTIPIDRLYKLININLTINENYDNFEVVLQRLLNAIELITQSDTTSLLVYDTNKKDLVFRYATGVTSHDVIGLKVPFGSGIAHHVAKTRKGVVVNTPEDADIYQNIDIELNFSTKSLMAYPVLDQNGDVFGIVETCNKQNNSEYTDTDFQLLAIFCQQAEKTIRHALHIHTLRNTIQDLHVSIEKLRTPPLIFDTKEMRNQIDLMFKLSKSDAPVLICGDVGTGKSLFSKHIHKNNSRHAHNFTEINCFSLVKNSQTMEELKIALWGIDKNYKIGVKKESKGFFEKTQGGTVVLDEVWALPIEVQQDLILLLQHKIFKRVHSTDMRKVNVKIICNSTKDISFLVSKGEFLEELFFLINSLTIKLTSINKRIDDLYVIAKYYIEYYIDLYHKPIKYIDEKVYTILKRYVWEYNLHSLIQTIQYLVLDCLDEELSSNYVAACMFKLVEGEKRQIESTLLTDLDVILPLKDAINKFKSQYIHKVLLHNKWNHTKASKELEIQRSYLSRLVKDYELNTHLKSK